MLDRDTTAAEARAFARYLIGEDPPPPLVERYADAVRAVVTEAETAFDRAACDLALRRPWSLGPLEAGLGWSKPTAPLRRKLVVMTAILETTPAFSASFEALTPGPLRAALKLAVQGVRASAKSLLGLVLIGWLRARV